MVLHDDRSRSFLRRAKVLFVYMFNTSFNLQEQRGIPTTYFCSIRQNISKAVRVLLNNILHYNLALFTSCFCMLSTSILTSFLRSAGDGLLFAMASLISEGMSSQGTLNVSAQAQDAEKQAVERDGVELELSDPGLDISKRT